MSNPPPPPGGRWASPSSSFSSYRSLTIPSRQSTPVLKRFRQKRPKWVDPTQFLHPELQNLFDLCYFAETDTLIPTGWSPTQDDTELPRLSSRQPKPAVSDIEMRSPGPLDGSDESGSEESTRIPPSVVTRMADESSEDDSDGFNFKVCEDRPHRIKKALRSPLTDCACARL